DPTKFVSPDWGRAIRAPSPGPYVASIPNSLPRELPLSADTVLRLSDADAALGRLAGSGRFPAESPFPVNPFIPRGGGSSPRIEGPQASVTEVFDAAATGE